MMNPRERCRHDLKIELGVGRNLGLGFETRLVRRKRFRISEVERDAACNETVYL